MRRKLVGLFIAVILALVGLTLRITYINATQGEKYQKQVLSQTQQQYTSKTLPYKRGDIYDRNGNILAVSNKVYNVILDCNAVNSNEDYVEPTIAALESILGIDGDTVRELLTSEETSDSQYQILAKEISIDERKAFEEYQEIPEDQELTEEEKAARENVTGVWFEETYVRSYPFNSLACDTIGFTYDGTSADWGLEGYYSSTLNGVDGRQYGYFNEDYDVEQDIIEPTDGQNITTTLDVGAQQIVEKYVDLFNKKMGAKNVAVIVENPNTGEIIAMDGGSRYDLNDPRDLSSVYSEAEIEAMNDEQTLEALYEMWRNYCVTDAYEPGSVAKPMVMAAALEKGAISEDDTFVCDGYEIFGADETRINCANTSGHGTQTLEEVIANSCNDAMMQIGAKMGIDKFLKSQTLFNFGTRTGIDLPGEGTGIIHDENSMGVVELACSAFGQGYTCTMIQEINAICSVINGGYYYQPYLVSKIQDSSGSVVKNITPTLLKQTISENISADIRSYMQASVEYGTSQKAKVQGYSMGGKTATAEKQPRGNGKYLVGFIGFAPVDDPQVCIYVVVDEPNAERQDDSSYAQYIAQGILYELLPYLNIQPDETTDGYVPETVLWEGFTSETTEEEEKQEEELDGVSDTWGEDGSEEDTGDSSDEGFSLETPEDEIVQDNISNTSVPDPPEDDTSSEDWMGNDQDSEGITNEDAGLEN
ncbi:MAG TPA: cell division protein FtsI [Candidatus Blautia gallistercoris]|uniref:Cell division protein FtsI n=1 Tax=Candidatus Blautia gallistercoris TaxID=2838490 RepID=A0A9D2B4Y5_9FIRM|nr:cell division protein FtsI [Candidatus Blautia gallistercoris]